MLTFSPTFLSVCVYLFFAFADVAAVTDVMKQSCVYLRLSQQKK